MANMTAELFSKKVIEKYSVLTGKENAALDPAIILVVMQIVQEVIALLQNCRKTPADAIKSAKNPSLWERLVVRNTAIDTLGRREFRDNGGSELVSSILSAGASLEVKEAEQLFSNN